MSPQVARALLVGDHIGIRGAARCADFSNIGIVKKKTREAVYVQFIDSAKKGLRFAFDNQTDMAALRRASATESKGYERANK